MNEDWECYVRTFNRAHGPCAFVVTVQEAHHARPGPWEKTLLTWGSVELQVWLRVREAVEVEEAMEGDECVSLGKVRETYRQFP